MKKILAKILKVVIILSLSYWLLTTLYFGYTDIDEQKGIYKFYWSGLKAVFNKDEKFGFAKNKSFETKLDGLDGPYIIDDVEYRIGKNQALSKKAIDTSKSIVVEVDNPAISSFELKLNSHYKTSDALYSAPTKIIAISDIEGNFNGLYSFLLSNKVIDKNCNWIFNDGHLVINGDFVDRGKQVTQVLWLLYKLDYQAEEAGGKMHYIIGNHETMMLYGDVSYSDFKYMEAAKQISKHNNWDEAVRFVYSEKSELGKWLRTKNVIERIGTTIFVHGGLNIHHVTEKLSIEEINTIARKYYGIYPTNVDPKDFREELILSSFYSPYWDRSLCFDFKYQIMYLFYDYKTKAKETSQPELERILKNYSADRIVIGHSVVDDITLDYDKKVVKIDIRHSQKMYSGQTKGIMLENNSIYKIDDAGKRDEL